MAARGPSRPRRHILIHAEDVLRIVFRLQRGKALVIGAVRRSYPIRSFVHHEVDVGAAGGERVQGFPRSGRIQTVEHALQRRIGHRAHQLERRRRRHGLVMSPAVTRDSIAPPIGIVGFMRRQSFRCSCGQALQSAAKGTDCRKGISSRLVSIRVGLTSSFRLALTSLVQHNSGTSGMSSNVRFRWEYRRSSLFVVDNASGPARRQTNGR